MYYVFFIALLLGLTGKFWCPALQRYLVKKSKQKQQRKQAKKSPNCLDSDFKKVVAANDRGEAWAQQKIKKYQNQPNFLAHLAQARLELYQNSRQGDTNSQYLVGISYFDLGKPQEALAILEPMAKSGNIKAMEGLAIQYTANGYYGNQPEQYLEWEKKAALSGSAAAQCSVAIEYESKGEFEEALLWYQMAAKQGSAKGCIGVANIHLAQARQIEQKVREPSISEEIRDTLRNEQKEKKLAAASLLEQATDECTLMEMIQSLPSLAALYSDPLLPIFDPEDAYYHYYLAILANQAEGSSNTAVWENEMKKLQEQYHLDFTPKDLAQWKKEFFEK